MKLKLCNYGSCWGHGAKWRHVGLLFWCQRLHLSELGIMLHLFRHRPHLLFRFNNWSRALVLRHLFLFKPVGPRASMMPAIFLEYMHTPASEMWYPSACFTQQFYWRIILCSVRTRLHHNTLMRCSTCGATRPLVDCHQQTSCASCSVSCSASRTTSWATCSLMARPDADLLCNDFVNRLASSEKDAQQVRSWREQGPTCCSSSAVVYNKVIQPVHVDRSLAPVYTGRDTQLLNHIRADL